MSVKDKVKEEALKTAAQGKAAKKSDTDIIAEKQMVNPDINHYPQEVQPQKVPQKLKGLDAIKALAMTPEDYQRINDQEYYIKQFLPKVGVCMFVSDSGNGKSWLAFMLVKRILAQDDNIEVIFFDVDSGAVYTKKRVRILWERFGQKRFNYVSQIKVDGEKIPELLKDIAEENLTDKIIIIDSLVGISGGEVNGSEKIKPILTAFEKLRNAGATVIVIHHTKKGKDDDGKAIYAGSYAIKGAVDSMYSLDKNDKTIECTLVKARADLVSRTFRITNFEGMEAEDIKYITPEEAKIQQIKGIQAKQDTKIQTIILMANDAGGEKINKTQLTQMLQDELGITQKFARAAVRRNVNNKLIREVKGEKKTLHVEVV